MTEKIASLGSVSSGTMREEDLIPDFLAELHYIDPDNAYWKELSDKLDSMDDNETEEYYQSEDANYDLDRLFDELDNYAPSYCYFGAHPGNGSDYGFWVSESLEYDFEGLKVNDLSEMPKRYTGEVLHINDHGNMTLYVANKGKLTELWGVV